MNMLTLIAIAACAQPPQLPVVALTADDTRIERSCRIELPRDTVLRDANGDGVIQIVASGIVVELTGMLRGAPTDAAPETYEGYAIRVAGQKNVTLRGGAVNGYRCAVWATGADGLTLEDLDASDNRRARLESDPQVEDGSDWMFPHENDQNQWMTNYATALYVEDARDVTVRRCRVWHGQSGLCLDRVNEAKIYDNDFSFNSGWGIALWRSGHNVITRNACDFCMRGYSHMVYNRGQDSAGILVFEQCSDNVFAENSATHGGDGIFGFAGKEALGEAPAGETPLVHVGCDRNLFVRNDCSYAAAHGIEMTFSFGNRYSANRLVGNAICGLWLGYSQESLVADNEVAANGGMGYGLERGGVNIDSGRMNTIVRNKFDRNECGVHLWWGKLDAFKGWAAANIKDWEGNLIAENVFAGNTVGLHFRGPGKVTLARNRSEGERWEAVLDPQTQVIRDEAVTVPPTPVPEYPVFGDTRPVGARAALRGRENIIMTEWGPWDHASPLVRRLAITGPTQTWGVYRTSTKPEYALDGAGVIGAAAEPPVGPDPGEAYAVRADAPGVHPYTLTVRAGEFREQVRGTLVVTEWQVSEFPWTQKPETELEAWRKEAEGAQAQTRTLAGLALTHGPDPLEFGLPGNPSTEDLRGSRPRRPAGLIARTRLAVPAGDWTVALYANGGVRLLADGRPIMEEWKNSGARRVTAPLHLDAARDVEFVVEQFRERASQTLLFTIEPAAK